MSAASVHKHEASKGAGSRSSYAAELIPEITPSAASMLCVADLKAEILYREAQIHSPPSVSLTSPAPLVSVAPYSLVTSVLWTCQLRHDHPQLFHFYLVATRSRLLLGTTGHGLETSFSLNFTILLYFPNLEHDKRPLHLRAVICR